MRYTLLMYYPEADAALIGEAAIQAAREAFAAYAAELEQARVLISAEVLAPASLTTTLTIVDGALRVQDGPSAKTEKQLGGSFVIEVPEPEAAIEWARKAPALPWGAIEVRPGATHTVNGVWTAKA